jgi:hypothetical protein
MFEKYCHDLVVCDYRRGTARVLHLLTTCSHHFEIYFVDHWHIHDSVLSSIAVSTSRFLATASTETGSSASRAQILLSQVPVQNFSTYNSTNWIHTCRLYHTNSQLFSSQAALQPTTVNWTLSLASYFTSLHLLNCWQHVTTNSAAVLVIKPRGGPNRKQRLQQSYYGCHGKLSSSSSRESVFADPCLFTRLLHGNCCTRCPPRGLCPATASYATMHTFTRVNITVIWIPLFVVLYRQEYLSADSLINTSIPLGAHTPTHTHLIDFF